MEVSLEHSFFEIVNINKTAQRHLLGTSVSLILVLADAACLLSKAGLVPLVTLSLMIQGLSQLPLNGSKYEASKELDCFNFLAIGWVY